MISLLLLLLTLF